MSVVDGIQINYSWKNHDAVELNLATTIYQEDVSGVTRGYEPSRDVAQLGKVVEVRMESVEKDALLSAS